jgi:hypothetical protein
VLVYLYLSVMQYTDYMENMYFSVKIFFVFSRNTNVFSAYSEKNVRLDDYFGGDGRTFYGFGVYACCRMWVGMESA